MAITLRALVAQEIDDILGPISEGDPAIRPKDYIEGHRRRQSNDRGISEYVKNFMESVKPLYSNSSKEVVEYVDDFEEEGETSVESRDLEDEIPEKMEPISNKIEAQEFTAYRRINGKTVPIKTEWRSHL